MSPPEPLGFQGARQDICAGGVTARPIVARHEAELDRITADGKDDRNS